MDLILVFLMQTALYLRFQARHPDLEIRERSFVKLRPFYVKPLKDRNVCCCRYHVELDMIREGMNFMRDARKGVHGACNCDCGLCASPLIDGPVCCAAHEAVFKGITKLWLQVVCPKLETEVWHNYDCLMGNCIACGVHILPLCPGEVDGGDTTIVKWRCFRSEVIGTTDSGQPLKKIKEVYMETSAREFLEFLRPKLTKFVSHNFVANWQDEQCHLAMENLPEDTILSHIDFAENYSFQMQNEIQSMHWTSHQVTILVHLTYRVNPAYDVTKPHTKFKKESHFYISDDREHDTLFVQHCLLLHWGHMIANGFTPKQHWVFSDGCSAQFKCSRAMYFVAKYPNLTNGCKMLWQYFGSGHGKGVTY